MKVKYPIIMTTVNNGYKVQVTRNSMYYIVKVGRTHMKNYQKKALSRQCHDIKDLKEHLQTICSIKVLDWKCVENQLLSALKSSSEGKVSIPSETRVGKGGIWSKLQSVFRLKKD